MFVCLFPFSAARFFVIFPTVERFRFGWVFSLFSASGHAKTRQHHQHKQNRQGKAAEEDYDTERVYGLVLLSFGGLFFKLRKL